MRRWKILFSESRRKQQEKGWQQFPYGLAYFGNDGVLRKGLQTINGKAYLFSQKGILLTGTQTVGNTTYYLSDRGRLEMKKVATQNGNLYYDGDGKNSADVKVQDIETLERAKRSLRRSPIPA